MRLRAFGLDLDSYFFVGMRSWRIKSVDLHSYFDRVGSGQGLEKTSDRSGAIASDLHQCVVAFGRSCEHKSFLNSKTAVP